MHRKTKIELAQESMRSLELRGLVHPPSVKHLSHKLFVLLTVYLSGNEFLLSVKE